MCEEVRCIKQSLIREGRDLQTPDLSVLNYLDIPVVLNLKLWRGSQSPVWLAGKMHIKNRWTNECGEPTATPPPRWTKGSRGGRRGPPGRGGPSLESDLQ